MYDIKQFFLADSIEEAVALKEQYPEAVFVHGGTDVMIRLKNRKLKDATLIGIQRIEALADIEIGDDGSIRIGAGCQFIDIIRHPYLNEAIPALSYACNQIGSPQIRNIATIGGNICNGAVSADSVPILLVHNATLEIVGSKGTRTLPLSEFHTGPGRTCLQSDEILVAINIDPANYQGYGSAFTKFGQRRAMEIATIGCAVAVKLNHDKTQMDDLRIALSVAAPTPLRCYETERSFKGHAIDEDMFLQLRQSVLSEAKPRDSWRASKALRMQLIKELSERTTREAIVQARGEKA